jgi:hypothetical protein
MGVVVSAGPRPSMVRDVPHEMVMVCGPVTHFARMPSRLSGSRGDFEIVANPLLRSWLLNGRVSPPFFAERV